MEEQDESRDTIRGKGLAESGVGAYVCNSSTQGPKLQASLGYTARYCLKYRYTEALSTRGLDKEKKSVMNMTLKMMML